MKLPNLEKAKIRTNSKTKTEEIEYFASDKFIEGMTLGAVKG